MLLGRDGIQRIEVCFCCTMSRGGGEGEDGGE